MNEPRLRFKADDGSQFPDWEEKKFANLYRKNVEKNVNLEFDSSKTISIASMQFNEKGNGASEDSLSSYKVLRLGDIAFEGHENKEYSHGRFVLNDIGDGIMSPRFSCMRPVCTQIDGFWKYYIHSERVMRNILVRSTKKGTMMHELVIPDFLKQSIMVPSLPEQQKIAEFLSTIDTVIEKQKETVSAWEERKKGVMQKLFSQEVRFKADDGSDFPEWEEKKLKNILKEYKEYSAKDGSYEHVSLTKEGVVPKSERYERDFLVKDVDKKYRITHLGDICYNPANLKFGVICRNKYGDGIFSPIYVTFKVCKDMLPEFVEMLVTRRDFIEYALKYQQGTVYERMSVSPDDLLSIKVMVPYLEEQQKIADCLSSLDEVIEKQKATLAAWEELKKGLLQQMFV